ncbi:hypothetical protein MNBD_NITROSPINAE04-869 [hydrothermal vent metagenome]|uniref:Uncharacterized protein n=1 Tax=hydrothermal vent metagenome TaxID=652676 RepID=A0A3B1BR74_9ZZZZ
MMNPLKKIADWMEEDARYGDPGLPPMVSLNKFFKLWRKLWERISR